MLVALLVCLIPTTIGGLLSAIGIAGMDRMIQANVIATSGRAVEAAGDVDVLLLDKTGTITLGNRQAVDVHPAPGVTETRARRRRAARLARRRDARRPQHRRARQGALSAARARHRSDSTPRSCPFTAQTRMSGVDLDDRKIRKGAADAIEAYVEAPGRRASRRACARPWTTIAKPGGTPLVVADGRRVLGVIELKDIVKGGIKERFAELRRMGIKTVMITGDNPLTAAAIAAEAGVDDFLAEATPEAKLKLIREYQADGRLVAMTGDGTNDAPALAQADVAVAMNTGTQAAKEAGNMVDLDSNPTKLIEIVEIGKQLLMTRGALTTFSASPTTSPSTSRSSRRRSPPPIRCSTRSTSCTWRRPQSAILSAVIFNALIIIALIPLALEGVKYRHAAASRLLRDNLLIYGLGGLIVPFVGIKLIDLAVAGSGARLIMNALRHLRVRSSALPRLHGPHRPASTRCW